MLPVAHTGFVLEVDQFQSTGVGLLCGCPMYRIFSVFWGLHCKWGITFTSGLSAEDPNLPQNSNTQLLPLTTEGICGTMPSVPHGRLLHFRFCCKLKMSLWAKAVSVSTWRLRGDNLNCPNETQESHLSGTLFDKCNCFFSPKMNNTIILLGKIWH